MIMILSRGRASEKLEPFCIRENRIDTWVKIILCISNKKLKNIESYNRRKEKLCRYIKVKVKKCYPEHEKQNK
jgi:hypothetical protein